MWLRAIGTVGLVFALYMAMPARADFEAGQRALDAGDIAEALSQWHSAARANDPRAMAGLGQLYLQGIGVLEDYVEAHRWFNLAASHGDGKAADERDTLAQRMTAQQVAAAQRLAREWQLSGDDAAVQIPEAEVTVAATPEHAESAATDARPPPQAIREAQELLAELGYDPGAFDGVWGTDTARAHGLFLRDSGLSSFETLTPQTLVALRDHARQQRETREVTQVATVDRPDERSTDVHHAVRAGDIDGLQAALATGADVNARDDQGWTALIHVAAEGIAQMVPALLAVEGVDVNLRAADGGTTALFIASQRGETGIVADLLDAGADVSIKGPEANTAMDIARLRNHTDIVSLLEAAQEDEAAFVRAKELGTASAFAQYLISYPRGRHANDSALAWVKVKGRSSTALEPRCVNTGDTGCWKPLNTPLGCFVQDDNFYADQTVYWSGSCRWGLAHGRGTLMWTRDNESIKTSGVLSKGVFHGRWVEWYPDGTTWEGPYVEGQRHGQWIERYANGNVWEGPYLEGQRHGGWTERYTDGEIWKGPYLRGKLHGRWVERTSGGKEWNCWKDGVQMSDSAC